MKKIIYLIFACFTCIALNAQTWTDIGSIGGVNANNLSTVLDSKGVYYLSLVDVGTGKLYQESKDGNLVRSLPYNIVESNTVTQPIAPMANQDGIFLLNLNAPSGSIMYMYTVDGNNITPYSLESQFRNLAQYSTLNIAVNNHNHLLVGFIKTITSEVNLISISGNNFSYYPSVPGSNIGFTKRINNILIKDGNPVMCLNVTNLSTYVVSFNGSNWTTLGGGNLSIGTGFDKKISFSPNGTLYLAAIENVTNPPSFASVSVFNGSIWSKLGGINSIGEATGISDVAFDNGGVPYIAYASNFSSGPNYLNVASFSGTNWVNFKTLTFSGAINLPRININSSNNDIYVSYFNIGSNKIEVIAYNKARPRHIGYASNQSSSICENSLFTLAAQVESYLPVSYQWLKNGSPLDGATNSELTIDGINMTHAGSYSVIISNENGSRTTTGYNITVLSTPVVDVVSGQVGKLCPNTSVQAIVSATGTGLSYQWSAREEAESNINSNFFDGISTAAITLNYISTSVSPHTFRYYASATSADGCKGISPNLTLTIDQLPSINTLDPMEKCLGTDLLVDARGSESVVVTWTGGLINNQPYVLTHVGINEYTYTGFNQNCMDTKTLVVTVTSNFGGFVVKPQPIYTVCGAINMDLIVSVPGLALDKYRWEQYGLNSNEEMEWLLIEDASNSNVDNPSTNYTVSGANSNVLKINQNLYGYFWSQPYLGIPTKIRIQNLECGNYTYTEIHNIQDLDLKGRNNSAISVNELFEQKESKICLGESLNFYLDYVGQLFNNDNSFRYFVTDGTTYGNPFTFTSTGIKNLKFGYEETAVYSTDFTCRFEYDFPVTVTGITSILGISSNQEVCSGIEATFNVSATGDNLTYAWSNGLSNQSMLTTSVAGSYKVTVTGVCGNNISNEINLSLKPSTSIVSQPSSLIVCSGTEATFNVSATGDNLTYAWSNGLSNQSILTTSVAGSYKVTVTGVCGNNISNEINLSLKPSTSIVSQPSSLIVCSGTEATFNVSATGDNLTYAWSNGLSNQSILTTSVAGSYKVTVTGVCGTEVSNLASLASSICGLNSTITSVAIVFPNSIPGTFTGMSANIAWPTLSGASTYCIRISKSSNFSTFVSSICGLTSANYLFVLSTSGLRLQSGSETFYYQVAGVDENGNMSQWSDIQSFILNIGASTSNTNIDFINFAIYPNPANDGEFKVQYSEIGSILKIYNSYGNVVLSQKLESESTEIHSSLTKGIYVVKVGSQTQKLIIE